MPIETQIAKWGNSFALRLPKPVALEAQVGEGDTVDVSVRNGAIVVRPNRPTYSLSSSSPRSRLGIATRWCHLVEPPTG